jgi:hypothetical protein
MRRFDSDAFGFGAGCDRPGLARRAPQESVHETCGRGLPRSFNEFYGFIYRRAGWNAIERPQLKKANACGNSDLSIKSFPLRESIYLTVKCELTPEGSKYDLVTESAIRRRQTFLILRKQDGRECAFTLDAKQNIEGRRTCRGDAHSPILCFFLFVSRCDRSSDSPFES